MNPARALSTAFAAAPRLAQAARGMGFRDTPRPAPRPETVVVDGKAFVAGLTCHADGTYTFRRYGQLHHRQTRVPADVVARLTPWERARVAHRLPLESMK